MEKSNLIISDKNSENIFKLPDNLIIKKYLQIMMK